jgi:hypothetical protein
MRGQKFLAKSGIARSSAAAFMDGWIRAQGEREKASLKNSPPIKILVK